MKNLKLALAVTATATVVAPLDAEERPNIIMIMCDDLGWGDVGFNGNKVIKTPNIDRLAENGVIFNRFFSACAVSSPTRASVLTGRNPYREGIFTANVGILRPEEITLPELLKEEGYTTAHFGKWHLGSLTADEHDSNRGRVGNSRDLNPPKEHGYDVAFVTDSKVPTWDPMLVPVADTRLVKDSDIREPYGTAYWDINGVKINDNLDGDDSRVIMDRVLPFIESSRESQTPFLSVVWFHTPHLPCVAGPEYAQMYSDYSTEFMNYAGCITALDDQIGRLMQYLEDNKLDKNTIITFCSDNGPEEGCGVSGGYRARKRSLYEGGVRVPSFVYWKSKIKGGVRTDYPAVTCDYLPTVVNLVGIDPAKCKYELDGEDLMPAIRQKVTERSTPIVLAFNGQLAYYGNRYKVYAKGELVEYYDLVTDPYESYPATTCPDADSKVKWMNDTFDSYRQSFEGAEYGDVSYKRMGQSWKR